MRNRKRIKAEDRITVHNEKQGIISSVNKIEKKGKEIKKKNWVISGIGIVVLLILGLIKKLIARFL